MATQPDLFTKRARKVKVPRPSETQIQISLVDQLRLLARPDVVYFHCPNGEIRDKRTAAKLKAMGVLPGVADLIFMRPNRPTLYLELKARGKKPTDAQLEFAKRVQACGASWEWADNLDDAVRILQDYDIMPSKNRGV